MCIIVHTSLKEGYQACELTCKDCSVSQCNLIHKYTVQQFCAVMHCTMCCTALIGRSQCLPSTVNCGETLAVVRLLEVELVRVELALAEVILLAKHSQHC